MINFIAKIRLNDHPNNQKISIYKKLYSKDIEVEVLKYSDNLVEIHHTGTKDNLFIKYIGEDKYLSFAEISLNDRNRILEHIAEKGLQNVSDSNLLMELYLRYGQKGFKVILDGFIFFLVDYKNKKTIVFRDHIGLKSFFYLKNKSSLFISTSFKQLTLIDNLKLSINSAKMLDFLNINDKSKSSTFINEIKKIPTNMCFSFTSHSILKNTYFNFEINNLRKSENEQIELLKKKLFSSVTLKNKIDANKVGFMFSGGLDSSAILSIFRYFNKSNQKLYSYTASFTNFDGSSSKLIDEEEYQKEITKLEDINDRSFDGMEETTLSEIDFYLDLVGQPFFFPNLYISKNVFVLAKKDDVRYVLNGNDGDTVISHGYEFLLELFFRLRWISLYKEISNISSKRKLSKKFIFRRLIINQIFDTDYNIFSAKKRHRDSLTTNLHPNAIEVASMVSNYYGINEIYPFYNKDLMELCINISPSLKIRNGYARYILRQATKGITPDKIRMRLTKSDLGHALCRNFVNHDTEIIEDSLENPDPKLLNFIDIKKMRSNWKDMKNDQRSFVSRSNFPIRLFSFVVLNRWLKNWRSLEVK